MLIDIEKQKQEQTSDSSDSVELLDVTFTIKDNSKKPVSGVKVLVGEDYLGTTNAKGICNIREVPEGEYALAIDYKGEKYSENKISVSSDSKTIDITIPVNLFDVKFSLKDDSGNPIGAAKITIGGNYSGTTDIKGNCTIPDVDEGEYTITVDAYKKKTSIEGIYISNESNQIDIEIKVNRVISENAPITGKELFSLLLPEDLNLNYRAEICRNCSRCDKEACQYDAYVVIKDGRLLSGAIDEKAYGSFSGKILDKIVKEYGAGRAREFLDRSTDLAICGIMENGITTSVNDEEIPEEAQDRIAKHLDNAEAKVDKLISAYEEGFLEPLPGRSPEETLEMKIMQELGEARDGSGNIAEGYLKMDEYAEVPVFDENGEPVLDESGNQVTEVKRKYLPNYSVIMARTGARASMLNLTQITACVGQQAIRGERIKRGYSDRALPHFKKNELGAKAKGFVHSSYKHGLDPIEFFFHAMGGREGLVDTAIRTAQSGYMQRRLVNALQDLQVKPSGLVTDNQGMVIQTMFGEDGVDPAKSDFGKAADLDKIIDEMRLKETKEEVKNPAK